MKGHTHFVSGVVLSTVVVTGCAFQSIPVSLSDATAFTTSCMIASVFPDVDSRNSRFGRFLFFLRSWQGTHDHRSRITHTPLFAMLSAWMIAIGTTLEPKSLVVAGWIAGYTLHLLLDSVTTQGIRLLYPISNCYYSFSKPWIQKGIEGLIMFIGAIPFGGILSLCLGGLF